MACDAGGGWCSHQSILLVVLHASFFPSRPMSPVWRSVWGTSPQASSKHARERDTSSRAVFLRVYQPPFPPAPIQFYPTRSISIQTRSFPSKRETENSSTRRFPRLLSKRHKYTDYDSVGSVCKPLSVCRSYRFSSCEMRLILLF